MDDPEDVSHRDSPQEVMYPDIDETMQYPWLGSRQASSQTAAIDPAIDPRLYGDTFSGDIVDRSHQDLSSDYESSPRKGKRRYENTFDDGDYSSEDPTYDISGEDESSRSVYQRF